MKKTVALLLAMVMLLGLAGCAEKTKPVGHDIAGGAAAALSASNDNAPSGFRVAMICDSSISDGGWGTACYNAMVEAAEERGWSADYTDNLNSHGFYERIVYYCDLGYNLIFAPGSQYTDAVMHAAEEYPEIGFALLNGDAGAPNRALNKNVASLLPDAKEIGWIAGALAGLMTESGEIAFIGGLELETTAQKYKAYKEAAEYVGWKAGKTVKTLDIVYSGSFSDFDKGAELAQGFIASGADVFFGDASAVDSGARKAIDEANAASGSVKIYDIAQPADYLGQNECIIGSQVTDNASMIKVCMEVMEKGDFGGKVIYGTLENGVLSAGALSDLVPDGVKSQYADYLEQMKAGTFMN